jgi:hypothetical protein
MRCDAVRMAVITLIMRIGDGKDAYRGRGEKILCVCVNILNYKCDFVFFDSRKSWGTL